MLLTVAIKCSSALNIILIFYVTCCYALNNFMLHGSQECKEV
jgi:hypothetical protein